MSSDVIQETSLALERTYAAPPERVYAAWLEKRALERWYAPDPSVTPEVHELDPREGGRFRIKMGEENGEDAIAVGEYRELVPGERIVFTFAWEGGPMLDTLVTVALRPTGDGGTALTLTHEKLPNAEATKLHADGWTGCLARLPTAL